MNQLKSLLKANDGIADLPLRIGVGVVFVAHGAQKLFGAFGGYGLEATGQWMASIGLEPGYLMALGAGLGEFVGGLLLLVGLLTRPAAVVGVVTMVVALFAAHWSNGFFLSNNGFEYALTLALAALALVMLGGGRISLDRALFGRA